MAVKHQINIARSGRLMTGDQAVKARHQHTKPCSDCPFARKSLRGWLGRILLPVWVKVILGDGHVECHTRIDMQCAGSSIMRANICKVSRDDTVLRLKPDTIRVFASIKEFENHHEELVK